MQMGIITNKDPDGPGSETLRRRGFRLTGPRRVILEVVQGTDLHPTAEWVHRQVRRRLPRVSLGTVYRNLRLLVKEGLVKELAGGAGRRAAASRLGRFDGNARPHHHFSCADCGRIIDLAEPVDRALHRRMAARTGLQITHYCIDFYGCCPACLSRRGTRVRHRKSG